MNYQDRKPWKYQHDSSQVWLQSSRATPCCRVLRLKPFKKPIWVDLNFRANHYQRDGGAFASPVSAAAGHSTGDVGDADDEFLHALSGDVEQPKMSENDVFFSLCDGYDGVYPYMTANVTNPYTIAMSDLSKTGPVVLDLPAGEIHGVVTTLDAADQGDRLGSALVEPVSVQQEPAPPADWREDYAYTLGVQAYIFSYPWAFLPNIRYAWVKGNESNSRVRHVHGIQPFLEESGYPHAKVARWRFSTERCALQHVHSRSQQGADGSQRS